jgi:hypothetical protein
MTDEEILGKIRGAANAPKFVDLYDDGNIKTHHTGDASGADLGLMGMLAFYTQDPAQLDRLFRRSALMRPKWDEKHSRDGKTYGQMTIDKALADIRETYTPPRENGVALMPDPTEERPRGLQGRRMVGEAISAGVEPPPMLLENFLYEAKLQSWTGEAGHGKSILALWASLQVMRDNKPVLYLDEEGSVVQVSERLEAMGAEPERLDRLFHYYQSPGLTLEDDALAALMETVEDVNPALVVFDSWVDFLALNGLSENDSVDVTRWVKLTVYPIRDAGATVLLLDHVNKENAGRGGRGSTAKLAKLDASFRLTQRREFDRDKVGEVTLKREKDRDAALPRVSKIVVGGDGTGKLQVRPDASMILPERDDELTDNDRAALAVLSVDGMGYREWMRAVGTSSSSSFDRSRDKLMRLGFVENRDRRYFQCSRAPAA